MKNILNVKVKKRETFRPFAPVIIEKYVKDYFYNYTSAIKSLGKYMLVVLPFKKKGKSDVPATVHVDGTGRLQSIERDNNPLYFDLIKHYQKKTKIPIIINTSFNIRGEPIVCTPEDAVNCFLNTQIDALVIGNYIIEK
jgi:carbamoyltransferase